MLFFWSSYSSKNPEKSCISASTKILGSTAVFNIDNNINVSWAANQHIRMISEGSCDSEDWSNDAENSALITEINYILTDIHTDNSNFKF